MSLGFITIDFYPAAAVATDGTMDIPYPSGYNAAAQFAQVGERLILSGLNTVIPAGAQTFTTAYDGNSVTVTYKDATTIPAFSKVTIQLPLADFDDIVVLTDNSGGTASNTLADVPGSYTEATLANQIASLAGKVNELVRTTNALRGMVVESFDRN
jgi:hypothetical protein